MGVAHQNNSFDKKNLSELLSLLPEEQRRHRIGTELYIRVQKYQPELAGKITGMFLEMEVGELLNLLDSPSQLVENVKEAIQVLKEANAIPQDVTVSECGA